MDNIAALIKLFKQDQVIDVDSSDTDKWAMLKMAITERVNELLDREPELLFSYLYRLDVSERKVNDILHRHSTDNMSSDIAELILQRQLARLKSKNEYKQPPIEGWDW